VSAAGEFTELARRGGRGALVTVLSGPGAGGKMLVTADGERSGSLGDEALEETAARHADELMWLERSERRDEGESVLFVDTTFPPPRLIAFGAVDFAAALCRLARAAGWRPFVVDPRARFAQPARFPDDAALIIALRSQAGYIGAMGSRRAQESRRERLLAKGVTDEEMERISAPIGLDLGALTAEETALSIMAEIVAMRYGRDGGRLAHAKGRIHEVGV